MGVDWWMRTKKGWLISVLPTTGSLEEPSTHTNSPGDLLMAKYLNKAKCRRSLPGGWVCRGADLIDDCPLVFCRVILDRINNAHYRQTPLSNRLGSVGAEGARTRYLLFATSTEWDVVLFVNFIDFQTAFSSPDHETTVEDLPWTTETLIRTSQW